MNKADTQQQIGKSLPEGAHRDAIHIAVAPMVAMERLWPGQHIGLVDGGASTNVTERIGIVDPFLREPIFPGTRFYMFLYPNTITELHHEWVHPAFTVAKPTTASDADHKVKSREWLESHAALLDLTFDRLMGDAGEWIEHGDHQVQHDSEHWRDSFDSKGFWHHYEIYTGKGVPDEKKEYGFYCCSC